MVVAEAGERKRDRQRLMQLHVTTAGTGFLQLTIIRRSLCSGIDDWRISGKEITSVSRALSEQGWVGVCGGWGFIRCNGDDGDDGGHGNVHHDDPSIRGGCLIWRLRQC